MQQINFSQNLDCPGNTQIFSITEEAKEIVLGYSKKTFKAL